MPAAKAGQAARPLPHVPTACLPDSTTGRPPPTALPCPPLPSGGDAFISICLWQAGFAFTDPGKSLFYPELQYFDPGPEDRIGALTKLIWYIDAEKEGHVGQHLRPKCNELCKARGLKEEGRRVGQQRLAERPGGPAREAGSGRLAWGPACLNCVAGWVGGLGA